MHRSPPRQVLAPSKHSLISKKIWTQNFCYCELLRPLLVLWHPQRTKQINILQFHVRTRHTLARLFIWFKLVAVETGACVVAHAALSARPWKNNQKILLGDRCFFFFRLNQWGCSLACYTIPLHSSVRSELSPFLSVASWAGTVTENTSLY